jgi:Na+-driven multidrug efflux pump
MTKKLVPLSETEKELFRKTLRNRLWIALIFGFPLLIGVGFMTYQFIDYQLDVFNGEINNNDWDFGSYFFFFFLVFCHVFIFFYAIPFYIKSH